MDTHVGREDMERLNPFWRGRPTLVTGATGFLGGCVVRQLLELGANVVCLVKDLVPECELVRRDLWAARSDYPLWQLLWWR
jgi:thioester reductase-like protein